MKMVDPKFNELPAPPEEDKKRSIGAKPRRGLSINETIAAEANRSIGAAGVDTSNMTVGFDGRDPNATINLEPEPIPFLLNYEEVALRAFELWNERGCPVGSPELDWKEAEADLLARRRGSKAAAASA
jgi:hypothetical protein